MRTANILDKKLIIIALFTGFLSGCFGSGGSGGSSNASSAASSNNNNTSDASARINVVVDGLQGSGLVLLNNHADALTIETDGTYEFATPMPEGSSFIIDIETQPSQPNQTCSVSDSQGVMRLDAGQTLVSINCVLSYNIGGTVSGLTNGNLTLKLNDEEPLVVDSNGEFNFNSHLPEGSAYAVTVTEQPASQMQSPSQNCSVSNEAGTMGIDGVSNIQVNCADTINPEVFSSLPAVGESSATLDGVLKIVFNEDILNTSVSNSSVTVKDDEGNAVPGFVTFLPDGNSLLFQSSNQLNLSVQYHVSLATNMTDLSGNPISGTTDWTFATRDGSWESPVALESDDSGTVGGANVAMDTSGNAVAVWRQHDGVEYNIMAARFNSETGWTTEEIIDAVDGGDTWDPSVAMDGNGNAIAVWTQIHGIKESVFSSRYVPDQGWSTPSTVELDNTAGAAFRPIISMNENGQAVVLWKETSGVSENIWSNTFVPDNGWGKAKLVETLPGSATQYQVANDAAGNAMAIWKHTNGGQIQLLTSYLGLGSVSWTSPVTVVNGIDEIFEPQVVMNQVNWAVFAWAQRNNGRDDIWVSRYSTTTGLSNPELIESDDVGSAESVKLAVDQEGNAFAVWRQHDGTFYNIMANRFLMGSGWQGTELVETLSQGGAYNPEVAIDLGGNAMVVWHQRINSMFSIFANRYRKNIGWGTARLVEFDNAGNAEDARIAVGPIGNAVAVWRQWDGVRFNIMGNEFK